MSVAEGDFDDLLFAHRFSMRCPANRPNTLFDPCRRQRRVGLTSFVSLASIEQLRRPASRSHRLLERELHARAAGEVDVEQFALVTVPAERDSVRRPAAPRSAPTSGQTIFHPVDMRLEHPIPFREMTGAGSTSFFTPNLIDHDREDRLGDKQCGEQAADQTDEQRDAEALHFFTAEQEQDSTQLVMTVVALESTMALHALP